MKYSANFLNRMFQFSWRNIFAAAKPRGGGLNSSQPQPLCDNTSRATIMHTIILQELEELSCRLVSCPDMFRLMNRLACGDNVLLNLTIELSQLQHLMNNDHELFFY